MPRLKMISVGLLIGLTLSLISCSSPPKVTKYIHSAKFEKFFGTDPETGEPDDKTYKQADKYICMDPDEYLAYINYLIRILEKERKELP